MRINPGPLGMLQNAGKTAKRSAEKTEHSDDQRETKKKNEKLKIGKGGFVRDGFGRHGYLARPEPRSSVEHCQTLVVRASILKSQESSSKILSVGLPRIRQPTEPKPNTTTVRRGPRKQLQGSFVYVCMCR